MFHSFSILFLVATMLSVINYKWLKLPSTIGALILSLFLALAIIASKWIYLPLYDYACELVQESNFEELLLNVLLSFLLFAGAIHIDLKRLLQEKKNIVAFASIGVILSTIIFGSLFYFVAALIGLDVPFLYCILLGAIISPTDPIAVLSILKNANVSESIEMKIEGESMFNDGFGVVVFSAILLIINQMGDSEISYEIVMIFIQEVIGGLAFGYGMAYLMKQLLRLVESDIQLSVMVTIGIVMGTYAIAHSIGTSGPLATVVMGIYIGDFLHCSNFSSEARKLINSFWKVLDEGLNTILFVLIGLSIHLIPFETNYIVLACISIIIILISRYISVFIPFEFLNFKSIDKQKTIAILTWGALRGGISLALVLSLPDSELKPMLSVVVFVIVIFSIIVQGLSIGKLIKRLGI